MKKILKFVEKIVENFKDKIEWWLELNVCLIDSLYEGFIELLFKMNIGELIVKYVRNLFNEEEFI